VETEEIVKGSGHVAVNCDGSCRERGQFNQSIDRSINHLP
jgi:hypothetical protein